MVRRQWGEHVTFASILYFYCFQYLAFCSFLFFAFFFFCCFCLSTKYPLFYWSFHPYANWNMFHPYYFFLIFYNLILENNQLFFFPFIYISFFFLSSRISSQLHSLLSANASVCYFFFSFILERIHFITWEKLLLYILFT